MFSTRSEDENETVFSESTQRKSRSFFRRKHEDKEEEDADTRDEGSYKPFWGSSSRQTEQEEDTTPKRESRKWSVFSKDDEQKKAVYEAFSNDPNAVIHVVTADEIPKPESSTDVVIKVQASTISLNDCVLRRGMSVEVTNPVCLPGTPGGDVVGVISDLGDRVEEDFGFAVGDRVAALIKTGGNSRYAVVPGSSLVKVPKSVSADDAACMVSTFMTAYQAHQMVCPEDKSLSGKKVLISGGTGPLGQALIQFAKRAGAQKIYTTAHHSRHRYVRMFLGATPLPLEPSEWLPLVEGNMDVVFDSACQDGYESSQKALSDDGKLICVGMYALLNDTESTGLFGAPLSAYWTKSKASMFMSKTWSYEVYSSFSSDPEKFKRDLETLFVMLKKREVKPHIVKRVGLSNVGQAQAFIENGKAIGTVVCVPWRKVPKNKKEQEGDGDNDESSMSVHSWYK